MTFQLVYVTTRDANEAKKIAQDLLTKRLVACVNIIGPVNSLYAWEGKICDEQEVVLIAKTRQSLVEEITAAVKKLHRYECPCIVSWPLTQGNPDFFDWIEKSTQGV